VLPRKKRSEREKKDTILAQVITAKEENAATQRGGREGTKREKRRRAHQNGKFWSSRGNVVAHAEK